MDKTNDAVFLSGKIHGCEDEIYIIYENPQANEEKGSFEICVCDYISILDIYKNAARNAEEFFEFMSIFGRWSFCDAPSSDYDDLCTAYDTADFIFGRDGGIEAEMNFIVNWAKNRTIN